MKIVKLIFLINTLFFVTGCKLTKIAGMQYTLTDCKSDGDFFSIEKFEAGNSHYVKSNIKSTKDNIFFFDDGLKRSISLKLFRAGKQTVLQSVAFYEKYYDCKDYDSCEPIIRELRSAMQAISSRLGCQAKEEKFSYEDIGDANYKLIGNFHNKDEIW